MTIRFKATEPGPFSDSELHGSLIDHFKAQLDVYKHVATLDTGALLLTIALIEKVFATPTYRFLIGMAVVMFLLSLLTSGVALLMALGAFPRKGAARVDREFRPERFWATFCMFMFFFLALLALTVFFIVNWFR